MGFSAALIFLIFLRKSQRARQLFYFIWMPSLLCGFLTSTSSSNFALNFNIGFFPAALLAFIYTYLVSRELLSTSKSINHYLGTRSVLVFGMSILLFFQFNFIYGVEKIGGDIYKNNQKVTLTGPFNGLYLEPKVAQFITDLQKDIARLDTQNKYIYLGYLSGAYLLPNSLKPGEYILYCPYSNNHFGMKIRLPNYMVNATPTFSNPAWGDFHKTYLTGAKYRKILGNKEYEIYEGS
jgi:hypothetical protein